MNGSFIKEMDAVPLFENMHPRMTMLDGAPGISDTVSISAQTVIALQAWLSEE